MLMIVFLLVLLISTTCSSVLHTTNRTLDILFAQLDDTTKCNSYIISSILHDLIEQYLTNEMPNLLILAELISYSQTPYSLKLPTNSLIDKNISFSSLNITKNRILLRLNCDHRNKSTIWNPILIYPLQVDRNSFLIINLPNIDLNACAFSTCTSSKCTWTNHGGTKVYARACCSNNDTEFCRSSDGSRRYVLVIFNAICAIICFILIPIVVMQRKRNEEFRGWALMEIFLFGAATLYSILLMDWFIPASITCCLAIWLRQIGFSTFYGSIFLKIYRNLQEYRVRKAHHVSVKEEDLLKYLACILSLSIAALIAWTIGSWSNRNLWESAWPQCSTQIWSYTWYLYELVFLIYGLSLCYKARNCTWLERWQFSAAVCLETIVTLLVNIVRLIKSESARRLQTLSGSHSKAHPSLAKLRDNLLNGTVDFTEIPIADMNPDDIRAELNRAYTELRMYKLKNIYQDNPHISKRKGGKKSSEKTVRNRRISLPSVYAAKNRRCDEEDRSDFTVESAPHNVFLCTYKLNLEPNESVRV